MTQGGKNDPVSMSTTTTTTTRAPGGPGGQHDPQEYKDYPTDTIAAVTIAVLAVVIVITLLLIFRALRKRRRARQGEQFGTNSQIHTLTTGVMGSGGTAYGNMVSAVPVRGSVSWESVNPSGAEASSSREPVGQRSQR